MDAAAKAAAEHAAVRYAERLLEANGSRVLFDLRERMSASRRDLEGELTQLLNGLAETAARALQRAKHAHAEGEAALARARQDIAARRAALTALPAGFDTAGPQRAQS